MLASRGLSAVMLEKGKVKGRQQVLLNRHEQLESPKQPVILVKRWGYVLHKSRYVDLASTVSIHRLRWAMDGKRLIAPLLVFDVSEFRLTLSDRVWHTHNTGQKVFAMINIMYHGEKRFGFYLDFPLKRNPTQDKKRNEKKQKQINEGPVTSSYPAKNAPPPNPTDAHSIWKVEALGPRVSRRRSIKLPRQVFFFGGGRGGGMWGVVLLIFLCFVVLGFGFLFFS